MTDDEFRKAVRELLQDEDVLGRPYRLEQRMPIVVEEAVRLWPGGKPFFFYDVLAHLKRVAEAEAKHQADTRHDADRAARWSRIARTLDQAANTAASFPGS
jgi:hypothetical protein